MPCSNCGFLTHNAASCGKQKQFHFKINKELRWVEFKEQRYVLENDLGTYTAVINTIINEKEYCLQMYYIPNSRIYVTKSKCVNNKIVKSVKLDKKTVSFELI